MKQKEFSRSKRARASPVPRLLGAQDTSTVMRKKQTPWFSQKMNPFWHDPWKISELWAKQEQQWGQEIEGEDAAASSPLAQECAELLSPGHGHSKSLRTKSFKTHTNSKTLLLFGFVVVVQGLRGPAFWTCCCYASRELSEHTYWSKTAVFSVVLGCSSVLLNGPGFLYFCINRFFLTICHTSALDVSMWSREPHHIKY